MEPSGPVQACNGIAFPLQGFIIIHAKHIYIQKFLYFEAHSIVLKSGVHSSSRVKQSKNSVSSLSIIHFFFLQGRTNLPPEKVPWDALVTLLSQCIYGGKIDNDFDQRLLASFLAKLFTPRSFEADFALVANVDGVAGGPGGQRHITMPDGTRRDHFLHWIESLADRQTPSWLGLPNNAEKVLLTTRGTSVFHTVFV